MFICTKIQGRFVKTRVVIMSESNTGLQAELSFHFGKAPYLTIIDSETLEIIEILENKNHHFGGELSPPKFLKTINSQEIITKRIGENALASCKRYGIKVYLSGGEINRVKEAILAYKKQTLREATEEDPAVHASEFVMAFRKEEQQQPHSRE